MKVPVVKPKSWKEISKDAYQLIRDYRPELLEKLGGFPLADFIEFDLIDYTDFKFSIAELPAGIEAVTDLATKELTLAPSTYEGLHNGIGRCRFTVAHELGHIFEHQYLRLSFENGNRALRLNRGLIRPFQDPEAQANVFAAALLMPRTAILNLDANERTPFNISKNAGVSYDAAEIRLKTYKRY